MTTNRERAIRGNLLVPPLDCSSGESFEELLSLRCGGLMMERIFSGGHTSPEGFWYDQEWDEIVVVVRGRAVLEYDGSAAAETLADGDWLLIPARRRHRVASTSEDAVWLALHLRDGLGKE